MINKFSSLVIILLFVFYQHNYCQDSTYRVLRYVIGSGGILYSSNTQYLHLATAGEVITGFSQTQNNFLGSGFWNHPPFGPSSIDDKTQATIPHRFQLYQNYPNPFNPTTIIKYDLPEPSNIKVEVFNILGEKIVVLIDSEIKDAGYHQTVWDGRNRFGNIVSSGAYIYRIEAKSVNSNESIINQDIKKMIFLK